MAKKSILGEFAKKDFKQMAFNNQIENIHYTKIRRPGKNRELRRIEELAEDIREDGLENNLLVRKIEDDQYDVEIVGGERRYSAIMLNIESGDMSYEYIPCKVVTLSDLDARKRLILNNNQNDPLTNAEKIEAVEELREIYRAKKASGEEIPGRIQQIIANEIGVGKSTVANYEKIINNAVPEVRELIKNEDLTIEAAISLVDLDDDDQKKYVEENTSYIKKEIEAYKADKERQLCFDENDDIVEEDVYEEYDEADTTEDVEGDMRDDEEISEEEHPVKHTIDASMTIIMNEIDALKERVCGVEFKEEEKQLDKVLSELNVLLTMFGLEY